MTRAAALLACLVLAACGQDKMKAAEDFGAAQTARAAVAAEQACAKDGFEDLPSCTESQSQDVRRGAKTALEMADVYRHACAGDLGLDRCDNMLMSAYYSAKK